jgi:hypothetical protein
MRKFARFGLVAAIAATSTATITTTITPWSNAKPAEAALGDVPEHADTWAWCGVHPDDPTAAKAATSMATVAGIDATFGPCYGPPPGYTPAEPGTRYVAPEVYRRLVDINAAAGMKTVVYDKRVWSDDPGERAAAVEFWAPVLDDIEAWDLGDEFQWTLPEWDVLVHRWNVVLTTVTPLTGIRPFTNHWIPSLPAALEDLPTQDELVSFTRYTDDLGASVARQYDSIAKTMMCGINTYDHLGLTPTPDKIRQGMRDLADAGCDQFLVFGGELVYDDTATYGTKSIVDAQGNATDWAVAVWEGSGRAAYTSIVPARVLETRAGLPTADGIDQGIGRRAATQTTKLQITGRAGVPATATSAVVNVTAINAELDGFLTLYPCDEARPNASQMTYAAATDTASAVATKLAGDGSVCLYTSVAVDLAVDVNGYAPNGSSFVPLRPARLIETRQEPTLTTVDGLYQGVGFRGGGSTTELQVTGRGGVPAGSAAVALSVTATNVKADGYITIFPCTPERPNASHVNVTVGRTTTNSVIAPLRDDGRLCVFTLGDIDLVVDVTGYFGPRPALVSVLPQRLLDTRLGGVAPVGTPAAQTPAVGNGAARGTDQPIILPVAGTGNVPANAPAVVVNLVATGATEAGFLTVYPCGTRRPLASNLNFAAGATVANMVVAQVGNRGSICIHRSKPVDVIVDLTNFYP